jgi:DNA-binding transcriptional ArsR family regulator
MDKLPAPAQLDVLFGALAYHKRRDIVRLLALHPATVKQLADEHNMSLPAIHKHIRILEEAGLISRRKVGRTNFVALQRSSLNVVRDWALQYRTDWGNDKETLENYIASMRE